MLQALKDKQREDGFTLIELMVVVLIIAILIAIAIPTFLGARERAQDKAAQSDLRNALTAAKVLYTDSQDYSTMTEAQLEGVEPSLDFVANVGSATEVGFRGPDANTVVFVKQSATGTNFCVADDVSGPGTTFGELASPDITAVTAAGCTGGW